MRTLLLTAGLLALALTGAQAAPTASAARGHLDVRIWADNDRDLFRSGERVRLRFRTTGDAYVAVVHLSTDGELEFVYPESPLDDGYVRGGRTHTVSPYGGYGYWTARGTSGIGYFFVIAADEPLDLSGFRDAYGRGWGFRRVGRVVRGDPFYVFDRLTRELVPDPEYTTHAVDYFTYHLGRRHSYPRYACYDGYRSSYGWWGEHYDSCDRLRTALRHDPYYYDTRYHRGTRRTYLTGARDLQPRHRYKEPETARRENAPPLRRESAGSSGTAWDRAETPSRSRPEPEDRGGQGWREAAWEDQEPRQGTRPARSQEPQRTRPTLQRRPPEQDAPRPRSEPPARREPPAREQPRADPPPRERPPEESRPRVERPETPPGAR